MTGDGADIYIYIYMYYYITILLFLYVYMYKYMERASLAPRSEAMTGDGADYKGIY